MTSLSNTANKTDKRAPILKFLSGYLTAAVALLFAVYAAFSIMAITTGSSFLGAVRFKFSKTPGVLTLGEQLIEVFSYLSPLLLAVAFFLIFFLQKKAPKICAVFLSVAILASLSGITLFACLNTYNIMDLFNTLSANTKYIGPEMKAYYTNTLIVLASYQILLPVFAGTLVRFASGVKKTLLTDTVDTGGALPFAITNLLLAFWHIISLPLSSKLTTEYFQRSNTESTGYYISEITAILCALLMGIFAYIYYLKGKKTNAKTSD